MRPSSALGRGTALRLTRIALTPKASVRSLGVLLDLSLLLQEQIVALAIRACWLTGEPAAALHG